MKRSDLLPGVQFQITDPHNGQRWKTVYTYEYLDPESKYPVEILRIGDADSMNVKLTDRGMRIYGSFGGIWMESQVVPWSRIVLVTPETQSN